MAGGGSDTRDEDLLPVLQRATHEDLDAIAEALDRSWDVRIKADERFRSARHDLRAAAEAIEEHILRAGGNSFRNWCRGGGPPYGEVLRGVCGVMRVEVSEGGTVLEMEEALLRTVVERAWEGMTPREREEIVRAANSELGAAGREFDEQRGSALWVLPLSVLAAQIGARLAGFVVYQVASQVANAVARQLLGHGLKLAANAALARAVAAAIGPIGWAASAVWMAVDIAGPSYKGLAPAVFHVAVLRQRLLWADEGVEA